MAEMQDERDHHSCGLVTNPATGEKEIVAVSGDQDNTPTEIYNIEENTWRPGPPLPDGPSFARIAQDGRNSFFVLGGRIDSTNPDLFLDTIYRFDEDTYDFVLLDQRLPYAANRAFGMMVSQRNLA